MLSEKTLAIILKITLVQVPSFALTAVIYGLGLTILSEAAQIEFIDDSSQLCHNQLSLSAIFISFIVIGGIHLISLIVLIIFVNELAIVMIALGILNLIFNIVMEGIFFKFALCFNIQTNSIFIVARSCLVIVLMIFYILLPCLSLFYSRLTGEKKRFTLVLTILLILPSIPMLVLNAILIANI